ncbi:GDSL-type esterase/lipase family protein, partial [Flavobacteriaceae bacterium]|nr:GDSL-type esterase/lipase family protein [Flavobacteriaceae bacterium]
KEDFNALKSEINLLNTSINLLNSEITSLQVEVSNTAGSVSEFDNSILILQDQITSLQNTLFNNQDADDLDQVQLQNDLNNLGNLVTSLQGQINSQNELINQISLAQLVIQNGNVANSDELTTLQSQLSSLSSQITTLHSDLDSEVNNIQNTILENQDNTQDLITGIGQQITDLNSLIGSTSANTNSLQEDFDIIVATIFQDLDAFSALQLRIGFLEIAFATDTLLSLEEQAQLQTDLTSLYESVTILKEKFGSLNELKNLISIAQSAIHASSISNDTLLQLNEQLIGQNILVNSIVDQINSQVYEATNIFSENNTSADALNTSLSQQLNLFDALIETINTDLPNIQASISTLIESVSTNIDQVSALQLQIELEASGLPFEYFYNGKNVVAYGDSITARGNYYIDELLDLVQFGSFNNRAVSSSRAANVLVALRNDLIDNTFLDDVDLVTIFIGTNDYFSGSPLGSIDDDFLTADELSLLNTYENEHPSSEQFVGNYAKHLMQIFKEIKAVKPNQKIMFITTLNRGPVKLGANGFPKFPYGGLNNAKPKYTVLDLVSLQKSICNMFDVEILDFNTLSGWDANNTGDFMNPNKTRDGVHPSESAGKELAKLQALYLNTI